MLHKPRQHIKSRHITLWAKVCIVRAMVFPVVMYGCESWTMKKPEQRRIDAFEPWCWRRLLRVPWTPRRGNQSILKEINPEYSLEGRMATWCEEPTNWKRSWCWETEGRRSGQKGWDGIIESTDMSLSKLWEMVHDREAWRAIVHGAAKSRIWPSNWTTTILALDQSYSISTGVDIWISVINLTK